MKELRLEADRCLLCKNARCKANCPISTEIPEVIRLFKEGKLDEREWEMMKTHPQIGANILDKSHLLAPFSKIVLHHHERFDGKGYSYGLKGKEIPLGSRIIALCDSIDAMTSKRNYRDIQSFDFCYHEIEKNLGKMYDPQIGQAVLDHWSLFEQYILKSREK